MKNKKGFTLIELIAVIIIIGLVALIAIPFFTRSFEDFKKNFYTNLNTTFLNGGKEFFTDNSKYLPRRYLYAQTVSLDTLESENYLKSFKDYKGTACDLENSYVIVIKFGVDKYEYAECLVCPNDNYENLESPYCSPDWTNENLNIDYILGDVGTYYVYVGTDRDTLKEMLKVTLDVVKYNRAGEIIARVSGVGEDGIGVVYPSNLDIIDTNRVGEYETEYTYQGLTKKGKVIVYQNKAPVVVANRKQNVKDKSKAIETTTTKPDNSEYDNSSNASTPNNVWAQAIEYNMSSAAITEPGVTISEYQWFRNNRWETFCKTTGGSNSCTKKLDEEMNETVKFRSLDTKGHFGVISRNYVIRIDKTRPKCELTYPKPDGQSNWYVQDFTVKFDSKSDTERIVNGKNYTSGLVENYSSILVNGTKLTDSGVLGRPSAKQTQDNDSFTWYGYIEDRAGNWNVCKSDQLKKDKTPPECTISASPVSNVSPSTSGVSGSYKCVDATSKCKNTNSISFSNLTSNGRYTVEDKAGNKDTCEVKVCTQIQKKTDTCDYGRRCSDAPCQKYNYCSSSACGTTTSCASSCFKGNASNLCAPGKCCITAGGSPISPSSCYVKKNKKCRTSSCGCETRKRSISICGCSSWTNGSWKNASSCSASHCNGSNNVSSHVCCRDTYYYCGSNAVYLVYDSEGGTPCDAKEGTIGSNWGTLCTTRYTGHTFGGWYTQPRGNGTKITSNTTVSGSLVVYADWGSTYNLTYDNQGGTGCTSKNGELGQAWGELCVPTKVGSVFESWNTFADGDGERIDSSSIVNGDLKVYAQYDTSQLFITYNVSGGTYAGTNSNIKVNEEGFITTNDNDYYSLHNYGATNIDLADYNNSSAINIKKSGYSAISGKEWIDSDGNTYSQTTKYNYSNLCSTTTKDCFLTLNVNWEMLDYTISYDLDGGEVSGNPTTYTVETPTFTLKNPTKVGYVFNGWTGSNGNTPQTTVTIEIGSTGTKSYKANWKANVLKIKYYANNTSASWCGNNGTGYGMSSDKYATYNNSIAYQTINYGSSSDLWNYDNENGICFAIDWRTADPSAIYTIGSTTVNQTSSYSAATLASYGGCDLENGDCTITASVIWRKTKVKINYFCNGGKIDSCGAGLENCTVGATDNGSTPCSWRSYNYDSTAASNSGVRNHKCIDGREGEMCTSKSGYKPTINWYIGVTAPAEGTRHRLDEDLKFDTIAKLVEYCENESTVYSGIYNRFKHHDVELSLYAGYKPR